MRAWEVADVKDFTSEPSRRSGYIPDIVRAYLTRQKLKVKEGTIFSTDFCIDCKMWD